MKKQMLVEVSQLAYAILERNYAKVISGEMDTITAQKNAKETIRKLLYGKDKIFDPFYTTKEIGKGAGLGLSITHSIITKINGTIEVKSFPNKGTKFIITIPTTKNNTLLKEEQLDENNLPKLTGSCLVVDDEKDLQIILKDILEDFCLNTDMASDGLQAIKKVKEHNYDYIITDLKIPNMSGETFLKEIHKLNLAKDSKFFVITGGAMPDYINSDKEIFDNLVDVFIKKPFSPLGLYKKLIS